MRTAVKNNRLAAESLEDRIALAGDFAGVYGESATVIDLNTDPTGAELLLATEHNEELVYLVNQPNGAIELWRTDATTEGTARIKSIAANYL